MVVSVGVLGGFVGAARAVGADDGGERACRHCEKDFEGECEVADQGVAFLRAVDAGAADCETDYTGESAAFDCGAMRSLVYGLQVVVWVGVGVPVEGGFIFFRERGLHGCCVGV